MRIFKKQKLSKSIFYFISEIIIVTIGIFIAIQLNNLNENKKNKVEEKQALNRILSDLHTEKLVLKQTLNRIISSKNYLKSIVYQSNRKNLDSLYYKIGNMFMHYPMNSEYINLKYSGKLSLISNDTIRYNLVNYYEVYYTAYKEISDDHKLFMNTKVREYLDREFESDTTFLFNPKQVELKLKDKELNKIIIDQIGYYNNITYNIKTSRLDSIAKRIKTELKKKK